jgi:hypothetical protein
MPAAIAMVVLGSAPAAPPKLANITVYHVNPESYGGIPFNMDVGDVPGDLYFVLRSVVGPIECAQDPSAEDCTDVEVVSPSLVATKLKMEVNTNYGPYGHCNICTPKAGNWSGCTKALLGKYVCVGHDLSNAHVGFETVAAGHSANCSAGSAEWECWRSHLVSKVGGRWWSFFNDSYCRPGQSVGTDGCAWRDLEAPHMVNNTCLLDRVYSAIEGYHQTSSCYSKCKAGAGTGRNITDPCWIRCTYSAVLGPEGGRWNGTVTGMPLADIEQGWHAAFLPEARGGCPALTLP